MAVGLESIAEVTPRKPSSSNIRKRLSIVSLSRSHSIKSSVVLAENSDSEGPIQQAPANNNWGQSFNKDPHDDLFKELDTELSRFCSKSGVHKANVLRLALLPFLRQQLAPLPPRIEPKCLSLRVKVLQKWWVCILDALRDRSHPISGSDRSAYLEAVSGIVERPEWTAPCGRASTTTRYIFETLLYDTVKLAISKLSLKNVALNFSAFSGKILAYAFFWAPDVAPVLIHLIKVPQNDIDHLLHASFPHPEQESIESAVAKVRDYFPVHLSRLLGYRKGNTRPNTVVAPKAPPQLPDLYGPWVRRWASSNSDVLYAFLKHYYSIMSDILPEEVQSSWSAHLASPGLIIFQAFLLGGLDYLVHPKNSNTRVVDNNYNATAVATIPTSTGRRRVDRLKLLVLIREILHNDNKCVQYYGPYCHQFGKILHAVTLRTSVYDVESCIVISDLIEEYISSLVLDHSLTRHRVQIQKDDVIDWEFWIRVVERMLSSNNSHTELRALALLFNIWDHIPIGQGTPMVVDSHDELDYYIVNCEGLRWACTCWLLSSSMWERYFCHWHPLVRSYYHRLICWRVASVGPEYDVLSSILFSNYNSDARALLKSRIVESQVRINRLIEYCISTQRPLPSIEPNSPVINRRLGIMPNPAASHPTHSTGVTPAVSPSDSPRNPIDVASILTPPLHAPVSPKLGGGERPASLRRMNTFDVFDEIAYSYPTSMPPSELFPTEGPSRNSIETLRQPGREQTAKETNLAGSEGIVETSPSALSSIRKKWYKLTGNSSSTPNLKRYFSTKGTGTSELRARSSSGTRLHASKGSASPSDSLSTTSSPPSFTHTPVSCASSTSTPPSPRSISSLENMSALKASSSQKRPKKLTMDMIPPPPQLLRKVPEITRAKFKFGLVYCENSALRQQQAIRSSSNGDAFACSKSKQPPRLVPMPRLPFEDESEQEEFDDSGVRQLSLDDMNSTEWQKWRYAGRSLCEWQQVVIEFEDYVRNRKRCGATRIEEIGVPFMVAEIPAKLKAG